MQIKELLKQSPSEQDVTVKGWVRTKRGQAAVTFIAINDGSTIHNIQAVAEGGLIDEETLKLVSTGACVAVTGKLIA
jgi:asparaginyl-tRNA synthetase